MSAIKTIDIEPLYDRIIVERIEAEETTKGGIIIPDAAQAKPLEGYVVATGSGRVSDVGEVVPLRVKPGMRVLFGLNAGTEIKHDNQTFLLLAEHEVLAILREKKQTEEA